MSLDQIYYRNHHNPHSTGLPDYFVLEVHESDPHNMRRWGSPFQDPWVSERIPLDDLEGRIRIGKYRD